MTSSSDPADPLPSNRAKLLPDGVSPAASAPVQDAMLFRMVADTVGDAVIVTSAELDEPGPRIEYVNPGFTRMTGYTADEVIGRTPRMLQGPRTDRNVLLRLRAALEAGESFFGTSINYRKDGTEFTNEWLIAPFRDPEGRIVRWVSTQRDVSERLQAEANQRVLLDELDHRVMNNLAAVQSLAARIGRTSSSVTEFRAALQKQLFALAEAHRTLADAHWRGVALQALAQAQLAPFGSGKSGRVEAAGPEVHLRSGAALVLGLAIGELGLNALRHGSLAVPEAGWTGLVGSPQSQWRRAAFGVEGGRRAVGGHTIPPRLRPAAD